MVSGSDVTHLFGLVLLTVSEYERLVCRAEEAEQRFADEQALSMARVNRVIALTAAIGNPDGR
jgi:hypothetical protein